MRLSIMIAGGLALLLAVGLLVAGQEDETESPLLGSGRHTYRWVRDWPQPYGEEGPGYTHGGIVIDSAGLVYLNTDTERAVCVFDTEGHLLRSFGEELAGGLHGMALVEEQGTEYLYLTHIVKGCVYKMSLEGELLWTLGAPLESGLYKSAEEYHPTNVAVAPNGDLYVADGYGKSWIHHYDRERKLLASFGGPGEELGNLRNPHGLMIQRVGERDYLLVSDRENGRLVVFDLQGHALRSVSTGLRRPCQMHAFEGDLAVADIDGKVTILDRNLELITHLGENPDPALRDRRNVPREDWEEGLFLAPHSLRFDAEGNLYVVDWSTIGRLTKLERVGEE